MIAASPQRRLALCMTLVAADWATSWPRASSRAPAASAPSWMLMLWAERTTTMLASSTATARALRITSAVMVAEPSAGGSAGITRSRWPGRGRVRNGPVAGVARRVVDYARAVDYAPVDAVPSLKADGRYSAGNR